MAIDGPAASGKTVIGSRVAHHLGYRFVDTGAIYRAATWLILREGLDPHDEHVVAHLVEQASLEIRDGGQTDQPTRVYASGEDVTPHLRDPDVETNVSLVSRVPRVRHSLVRIQRALADGGNIVMAGRDIGSVVLPDAQLKVYLDASREVRARRRLAQLQAAGARTSIDALVEDLARRDGIDSSRTESPLTAPEGAEIIRTDDMTIEQVVERILEAAR